MNSLHSLVEKEREYKNLLKKWQRQRLVSSIVLTKLVENKSSLTHTQQQQRLCKGIRVVLNLSLGSLLMYLTFTIKNQNEKNNPPKNM